MNVSSCLRLHLTLRVIKELEWRISQCITLTWQSRNLRMEEPTRDRCASAQSEQVPHHPSVGWVDCRQKWRNGFSRKMCSMWCIRTPLPLCGWLWMVSVLGVSSPMTSTREPPLATKPWQGEDGGCGREQTSTPSDQDPRKGVFLFGFVIVRKSPII